MYIGPDTSDTVFLIMHCTLPVWIITILVESDKCQSNHYIGRSLAEIVQTIFLQILKAQTYDVHVHVALRTQLFIGDTLTEKQYWMIHVV